MRFLILFSMVILTACGSAVPNIKPFKMEIQQGNVVTSKMLLKLRPGMTKSQVKYIMGTPLVVDSFHTNRWDYFYQMRQSGKVTEKRRVILDFEKDLLVRVRGDVVADGSSDAVKLASEPPPRVSVKPEEQAKEAGFLDKLKFWDKSSPAPEVAVAAAASAGVVADAAKVEAATTFSNPDAATAISKSDASSSSSMLAVPLANAPVLAEPSVSAIESSAPAPTSDPSAPAPQASAIIVEPSTIVENAPVVAAVPPATVLQSSVVPAEPIQVEPAAIAAAPVEAVPEIIPMVIPEVTAPIAFAPVESSQEIIPIAIPEMPVQSNTSTPNKRSSHSDYPEKLIFRMDRTLDLERGNQVLIEAPEVAPKPVAPVKESVTAPPAKENSFFDKMLEKIGF
jgi:outer membrane protein assembly factor BamE